MKRRIFTAGALALATAPGAARAQQPSRRRIVGYLGIGSRSGNRTFAAFVQALESYGWVEGRNIDLLARFSGDRNDTIPALAGELVALRPDVLFVSSLDNVVLARSAIGNTPTVFAAGADPVVAGVAESFRRPGGNVTGVTSSAEPGLWGKRFQLLLEIVPHAKKIGLLIMSDSQNGKQAPSELEAAAATFGVSLVWAEVRVPEDLDAGFAVFARERVDAAYAVGDVVTFNARARLAALELAARLPTMHLLSEYVEAGGLVSYGNSNVDSFRRAAFLVHKVLSGANVAELPIDNQPHVFMTLNLKTARAIGLTLPESILLRADEIIE